ncbi:DNA cytosine methyltransferase [Microbacterium binotii]|uniref:DNA cytosine methyltransferase n=1 Tax=Microbacterium binotii TaxID=462710 RepID=A0ABN3PDF0_9MICO
MTPLLAGELFAGVAGLSMAVSAVFGSRPGWFAEIDAAPSKVLAHRFPGVPNLGDVSRIDFRAVAHTAIRVGGFPCQDVSLAGGRRGMKDGTRSGLWSEFARSIAEDRPDWVVIENVRGLLSAEAHSDVERCPWCLGEDDEQHALRALGAVLGDLAELGFDAEWVGVRASDVGAPHGRFRVFILAWPRERTVAPDAAGRGRDGRTRVEVGCEIERTPAPGGGCEPGDLTLLPTPAAMNPNDGEGTESWLARRERVKATATNGNGMGMPLSIAVQLLPTPAASSGSHGGPNRTYGDGSPTLDGIMHLLPTPDAYSGSRGGSQHPDKRRDGGHTVSLSDVTEHELNLMPTPRATRGGSSTEMSYAMGGERADDERPQGVVAPADSWGPYAGAIRRAEVAFGRPAPSPVRHDGKGGKARLNPELPEWMMGWPAGWVTDPAIGLSRAEQLKAAGNGVVPQQAAYALRLMLARRGVPPIERRAA